MFLVAIGLFGLLFGVGSSEVRRFENAAARDIATRLQGTASRVQVRTKMDPFQIVGGRIKSATITASDFSTQGLPLFTEPEKSRYGRLDELKIALADFELTGLKVKRLNARIPNCRFDFGLAQSKGKIRLTRSGTGTGEVWVDAASLLAYILKRHPTIRDPKLTLSDGFVSISGNARFMAFESFVEIRSRLASPDGAALELADADIKVAGQAANPIARETILKILNPVVHLDRDLKLFGALKIEKVSIERGVVGITGVAKIPDHPMGTWMGRLGLLMP